MASQTGNANKVWKKDSNGVPGWNTDANTTYSNATISAAGLMSAADKVTMNSYTTPVAYPYTIPSAHAITSGDFWSIRKIGRIVICIVTSMKDMANGNNVFSTKLNSNIYPDQGYKFELYSPTGSHGRLNINTSGQIEIYMYSTATTFNINDTIAWVTNK